jgi:3-hydroxy-9,10-secoandrosta-1,3,5(10)-triene-9,17-dione monooxygenase reductase component
MHDAKSLRAAFGHYASGLTIVSALREEEPIGFTCQSFHSVSISPPLVSFNVMRDSTSWPIIKSIGRFSVNVLSDAQQNISSALALSAPDKWKAIEWHRTARGNPLFDSSLAWFECDLYSEHEAGDHTLVLARVVEAQANHTIPERLPLIFFRGQYCQLSARPDQMLKADPAPARPRSEAERNEFLHSTGK